MESVTERYIRGYQYIARCSTDKAVIKRYLAEDLRKRLKCIRGEIEILDVGCAEGDITHSLLNNLGLPLDHVALSLVEPSSTLIAEAVAKIRCKKVTPFDMTYERYVLETGNSKKYDLVFSCHSIYHTGIESIRPMLDSVGPGGQLFIIVSGSDDPFVEIKRLFPGVVTIAGDAVSGEIRRLGFTDIIVDSREKVLDVRRCVDSNGDLSEDGKDLASLLFYKDYEDLTATQRNAVVKYLAGHSRTDGIRYDNDFIWVQISPYTFNDASE
jgi:SAM-dependent methyltransferase